MYFAALEPRLVERRVVDEQVLRAGLAPDVPALLARDRDRLDRLLAGDVDDVERRAGDARELDGAVRRLSLRLGRPRARVPDRLGVAGRDGLLDDDVDRIAVLRVNHHERARVGGGAHRLEERLVVDHDGALVGHEQLVGRDALVRQRRELLERAALAQVGDADVEADVDHRFAALDLLEVVLERLGEGRARRLHAEVDETGRASEGGGDRAGGEVVAGRRAAEEHLQVRVRVDRPGMHVFPGRVDDLVRRHVQRLADQRHRPVLDEDVADVVVRGGDDAPALDEHGHARSPFSRLGVVYDGRAAPSNPSWDRWAGGLGRDIKSGAEEEDSRAAGAMDT